MSREEQIHQLLHKQVEACVATIKGKGNAAKGYRSRVGASAIVEVPKALTVSPAPVEVVKEVEKVVEKEVEVEKITYRDTTNYYLIAGIAAIAAVGGALAGKFFF